MNRESLDRIVVSSNAKMGRIIQWYLDNQDWLDERPFEPPFLTGRILLEEEHIEVVFQTKGSVVDLAVYPEFGPMPAVTFAYDPKTKSYRDYRYPPHLTKERRDLLAAVMKIDRTDYKEAMKYHALMLFALYYEEIVEVDATKTVRRSKHEAKQLPRRKDQPLSLYRKTYVVTNVEDAKLTKHGEKRGYTKPDHEVSVRGFFRTYQNGKVSWVKPHTRYKGSRKGSGKEYKV